jgi:hypothetical protein
MPASHFFVLLNGRVELRRPTKSGPSLLIEDLAKGSIFGVSMEQAWVEGFAEQITMAGEGPGRCSSPGSPISIGRFSIDLRRLRQ